MSGFAVKYSRKKRVITAGGVGLIFGLFVAYGAYEAYGVSPSPSPTLFPPRSPAVPTSMPSLSPTVTPSEAKGLLKQFNKAQDNELAALKHRHKSEMRELRAAHKAQLNEWESKERQARHQFFANNNGGPERRAYVQDYLRRREVLLKIQSDDEDRRSQEQSVRVDSLKNDQSQRLKEFQDFLSRGERPPARLWSNGS